MSRERKTKDYWYELTIYEWTKERPKVFSCCGSIPRAKDVDNARGKLAHYIRQNLNTEREDRKFKSYNMPETTKPPTE